MNQNQYWAFFSHDTDINSLEKTLNTLYGIHPIQTPLDLRGIYEYALDLCRNLGATDKDFFWNGKIKTTDLLDYLVTDALFHIRKSSLQNEAHTSLNKFFNNQGSDKNFSNFSNYMKNYFIPSAYPAILGIKPPALNCNYTIPIFMDRLLSLLISTIKKSPYNRRHSSGCSFSTLNTFFIKDDFYAKAQSLCEKDIGNQCISAYLVSRLFDVHTMTYISYRLDKMKTQIVPETILSYLLPIFFVPNTFGKRAYCDLIFKILESDREITTEFDRWSRPDNEIAYEKTEKSPIRVEEANLVKCRQYLLFLSTTYLPVLNACFYVLLRKAFPKIDNADAVLIKYLETRDFIAKFDQADKELKEKLGQFNTREKRYFSLAYSQISDILSDEKQRQHWKSVTSLNYIFPDAPFQKAILETVMKEKFGVHDRNTAIFLSFKEN